MATGTVLVCDYTLCMYSETIIATLSSMSREEILGVLYWINVWEQAENMTADEAAEWRLRALAYQRYVIITDDPDLVF